MKLLNYLAIGKTYIIAEMSGNHGGSLENAMEIVRAAKVAGADCIKIQTYTADTITIDCHSDLFLVKTGLWEKQYLYDLYQKAYTPWEWQGEIKKEAERLGLDFLSTPFDFTAVDFLEDLNIEFYKIASFELVDIPLIKKVASTGKPIIMSCGMASPEEIQEAIDTVYSQNNKNLVLLKCCSSYPADYPSMNLSTIPDMKQKFQLPVGLSDHSMGSLASVAAVGMGASVIEKHFCISRAEKTVDSEFSMEKEEFSNLVRDIRNVEAAIGIPSYAPTESEQQSYQHRRSLFAVKDIKKEEPFTPANIRSIRPGCGLHTRHYEMLIDGGYAAMDIPFGTPLSMENSCDIFHTPHSK